MDGRLFSKHSAIALVFATLAGLLAFPQAAAAYEEKLHVLITETVFPDEGDPEELELLEPPSEEEMEEFRVQLFTYLREWANDDTRALVDELAPSPELAGDAWRLKHYLLLNTSLPIYGIDLAPDQAMSESQLRAQASRWPDDDRRNQERFLYIDGELARLPDGSPRPADPAILHLGKSEGLSSQAHAHYALVPGLRSSDPEVLKSEPWRFSIPENAMSFGVDYAQMYENLATVAQGLDHPAARWMSVVYEGAAMHHLQDACNQIHTVQVGDYEFFYQAAKQRMQNDIRTVGGLLGPRLSLKELGVRYLTNYHLLVEELMSREMLAAAEDPQNYPLGARLIEALNGPDHEGMIRDIDAALAGPYSISEAVIYPVVNLGAVEVPEIYRSARVLAIPALMEVDGPSFDRRDFESYFVQPMDEIRRHPAYEDFFRMHENAMKRCGTSMRQWMNAPRKHPTQAAAELVDQVQMLHQEMENRNAAWEPEEEEEEGLNTKVIWAYAAGLAVLLILVGTVIYFVQRRFRKR